MPIVLTTTITTDEGDKEVKYHFYKAITYVTKPVDEKYPGATFTWADFLTHVGARKKDTPAFDAFDLSAGDNNEFGTGTTQARHFTLYSLRHEKGGSARLDSDLPAKLDLMNPMYHLVKEQNPHRSKH